MSPSHAIKAVVLDAHLRNSLAGIRGLGRAGVDVLAYGPDGAAPGLHSRYTHMGRIGPAEPHPEAFAARLSALAGEHGPLVAYPGQEATIDTMLAAHDLLPPEAQLPYSRLDAVRAVRNKARLGEFAAAVGLRVPATLHEATAGDLRGWRSPGPCVLKPVTPGGVLATAVVAESSDELAALLQGLPDDEPVLLQERARPPLVAVALVLAESGALVARFQQRAERTWPAEAGDSSVAVSVAPDATLVRTATALLREAGFAGLAQLQFVHTAQGPALIDVNPRFYGSLPLALACGANLAAAWHSSVTGARPTEPSDYRVGVRYRWLEGELLRALRGRSGPLSAAAVPFRPPPHPRVGAVWAVDDPLPGLLAAGGLVRDSAIRRFSQWPATPLSGAKGWRPRAPRARRRPQPTDAPPPRAVPERQ